MTYRVPDITFLSTPGRAKRRLPRRNKTGILGQRLLMVIAGLFFWLFTLPCSIPAHAAPPEVTTDIELTPAKDEVRVSGNNFPEPKILRPDDMPQDEVTRRPFLYWRAWANQRLPFGRVFFALFLASGIISFAIERQILKAASIYRKNWLRCFGVGILFFVIGLASAGVMGRMGLFTPVATALVMAVQIAGLIGLTVAAQSVGERILRSLRIKSKITKPWVLSLITLCLGAVVLSLLVLIPGLGTIPPMGTRMLALIAATGAGSFLIALRAE